MAASSSSRAALNIRNVLLRRSNWLPSVAQCRSASSGKSYSWEPEDPVTHTGQKWDKDDYRLARFVDRPKQVNKQFAIDLIAETPPTPKTERVVWCDGGGGPLGHPKVYINLDQPGNHACGYCGLRFYLENHDSH